jgi:hypothetical protein
MRNLLHYVTTALFVIAIALCGLAAAFQWPYYTILFFAISGAGISAVVVLRQK